MKPLQIPLSILEINKTGNRHDWHGISPSLIALIYTYKLSTIRKRFTWQKRMKRKNLRVSRRKYFFQLSLRCTWRLDDDKDD